MIDGITVKGIGHQILSKELYQEAIILSDMFDMNEYVALDLLCTAQMQMPYYPSLTRGLVAVLLYYDGRKALVTSLLYLVQARTGTQWRVNVPENISRFITEYTNQLCESGIFNRIFDLLRNMDLSKELEKLQQNLALGGPKHRRQIIDLFNDIKNILADIVFSWSAQNGLPQAPTISLINYLREVKFDIEASGKLDEVNLYLIMALLYAFDLSILHSREDDEEIVQSLPILSDYDYVHSILNEFSPTKPKWACEGLQALATFALSICLASLRIIPQTYLFQEAINNEDLLADTAIEMNVFTFIYSVVLENNILFKEPYMCKRIHNLLSDFIVFMFPKVKEMRLRADEISRTMVVYIREGLDAPANLPKYFEHLMLSIGKFYSNGNVDPDYLLNYWSPIDINPNQNISYRAPPPRAVSLFKFIRLAGDMLPTTLFVPYLTMLSGLSSSQETARHCFNLLKQISTQLSPTLSWDHFFMSFSQYYNNLRQEAPPAADTVYRNRASYHKGVSPQELEGLQAVLLLIRTVAEHDEFSRLALCEHPGWSPLTILLGLISCSVPIPLKAELLVTLAVLSKSSENAAQMWENLEASQILVTIPTTSSYAPRGIQTELEEIESRVEEYPLTRAFLKLLDSLTNFGIPRTLGAGPRQPGFDPYLSFIMNSVFLKFHTRSYRNNAEKWEVANLCLRLFEKFLNQYDPTPFDFPSNTSTSFNSPPGFHLMLQLNNKSEFLNVILDIIEEGNRLFDSYVTTTENVKDCTLACLNILNRGLMLQPRFFAVLASSPNSILLTSLSKLLLTVNRRSGKPDHCVNIAKYVSYQMDMPKHSHAAVDILNYVTSSTSGHSQFLNILLSSEEDKFIIKNGFVECLDTPGNDDIVKTKLKILKLLKQCLMYNAPNLTHFLLGFNIKRNVSKTEFQFPGVLDFPRSGLHALISILDAAISTYTETPSSNLLESVYHMIYLLASNAKTSGPVLRFIRLNKTFFKDNLLECHKRVQRNTAEINQLTWLLKTLAIELKFACEAKQVSYLKQLTMFLVKVPADSTDQNMFIVHQKHSFTSTSMSCEDAQGENFMRNLSQYFELKLPSVVTPQWEFFDAQPLNTILQNCQIKSSVAKIIDLKKLHQILYDELHTLQGTAVIGQIQGITQEIPKVLKYALELNKRSEACQNNIQFVNAWRQVAEVLVIFAPLEILTITEQQIINIDLLLNVVSNIVNLQLFPDALRMLSGSTLVILDSFKKNYLYELKIKQLTGTVSESEVNQIVELYQNALQRILGNLLEWILISNVTDAELRINLYASLVTFLQLIKIEPDNKDLNIDNSMFVSRLDSTTVSTGKRSLRMEFALDIIIKYGNKLIELLCNDCISGQEICKILAMSCLCHLIALGNNMAWIQYISNKGYLKHLIQSILSSDEELRNMLEPQVESIKPLYLYLAKMFLLTRIANTKIGAELLLEQKLFSNFSNMSVFTYHPEISKFWQREDVFEKFLPPVEQQYLQIWTATLDISNAILTTLGTENRSAVIQIMYFVLSQVEVIELVLRSGNAELSPMSLKELSLVTFIIARTANNDLINILENPNIAQNHRAQLYRIQKLMLVLLSKFILSEENVKHFTNYTTKESNLYQTSDRLIYGLQTMANLLCYARNVVANNRIENNGVGVIFYPSLSDPLLNSTSTTNEQEPSLGIIVQQLISTVNYQHNEKVTHDYLARKLGEVSEMNINELTHFIEESFESTDVQTRRERVFDIIHERLQKKKQEMEYCAFIIENCLYLIWTHLDYYMLRAIPKPQVFGTIPSNPTLKGSGNWIFVFVYFDIK